MTKEEEEKKTGLAAASARLQYAANNVCRLHIFALLLTRPQTSIRVSKRAAKRARAKSCEAAARIISAVVAHVRVFSLARSRRPKCSRSRRKTSRAANHKYDDRRREARARAFFASAAAAEPLKYAMKIIDARSAKKQQTSPRAAHFRRAAPLVRRSA